MSSRCDFVGLAICSIFTRQPVPAHKCRAVLICFRSLLILLSLAHCFHFNLYLQRDMTVQFVARVATFTIIFLLGCFCMSWQIFIGYRNIIRLHKAPCHTVVGRRMRSTLSILFVSGPVFFEKWKKLRY